ncbi:MAG: hypothetical protein LW818_02035 [Ignavibacteriae bacterium]|jgi:hypothetical protein|nr:hypothetical protein [Ignavibacteriota bacterium]
MSSRFVRPMTVLPLLIMMVITAVQLQAQQTAQIRSILGKFKSYRYSNVFLFQVDDGTVSAINPLLGVPEPKMNAAANRSKKKDQVQEAIDEGEVDVAGYLKANGGGNMNNDDREYEKYYRLYTKWQDELFSRAYIVTTRFRTGEPFEIIGLLTSGNKEMVSKIDENIDPPKGIFLANDLQRVGSPDTLGIAKTLYEYLERKILQNDAENVTAEAQGIGEDATFLPQKYGTTYPINEDDIQQYLRITDGQPQEYDSPNELTIGLFDLIRFRHYGKLEEFDEEGNLIPDDAEGDSTVKRIYNKNLPLYGVELRYGMPEINYPSLWSERMTLNVMWQSNKFGIVLPTNGWSSLATDVFSAQRKLTHAGLGIYGSLDFPIKLVNQGGVFNFNGSYVFGPAASNPVSTQFMFAGRNTSGQSDSASYRSLDLSYLPRFHAQAHYSFAVDIDRTAFFRFKLGATMYVIQRFAELEQQNGNDENGRPIYEKKNRQIDQYSYDDLSTLNRFDQLKIAAMNGLQGSEVVAGLSGRIEFMNRSRTVPWGASMQFFDGSISGDVWAQVPVVNGFDLRIMAQYFQVALRDPKPWEEQTIVQPSLQMLFNF